jgi:hypothetical protein
MRHPKAGFRLTALREPSPLEGEGKGEGVGPVPVSAAEWIGYVSDLELAAAAEERIR